MINVLHITPHVGGGVGSVLHNYFSNSLSKDISFTLACLDKISSQQQQQFGPILQELHSDLGNKFEQLFVMIQKADVVVIHWWNHPLLFDLLIRKNWPSCRVAIWSHVSGLGGTSVYTPSLLSFPDKFIFTTPISKLSNPSLNLESASVIWSVAQMPKLLKPKVNVNSPLRFLYVGTLDPAKMNENIIFLFKEFSGCNVELSIIGDGERKLYSQVKHLELTEQVHLLGKVDNAKSLMKDYDVFFYPLNPDHYGTCDQVLGEAMLSGLPVLAFDNPMERHIVQHGVTGFLAKNNEQLVSYANDLINDRDLRYKLGEASIRLGSEIYSTQNMIESWDCIYLELSSLEKTEKVWPLLKENGNELTGLELFIESVGREEFNCLNELKKAMPKWRWIASKDSWMSETKGSLFHYASFFPKDVCLKQACRILKELKN